MTQSKTPSPDIPLYISSSRISTEVNKTGSWRFVRPLYDEKTAPCSAACPAGEDIARIEMLAARGMVQAAHDTILWENPFPAICGRVCFHPCEPACNRRELDAPIAIHHLERFIGDLAFSARFPPPDLLDAAGAAPDARGAGKRIAIGGSGPAGLAAAYFLTRLGHTCDIFEQDQAPGGLLRWGIPAYRLPEEVLDREIQKLTEMGVRIHCGRPVTPDFGRTEAGRFDALFLACGYGRSTAMGIQGEDLAEDGLNFLHETRSGQCACFKGSAVVIGGGNTAVDVARTLIRSGVTPTIVYRRRRQDMPAFGHEVDAALAEGIRLRELAAPVAIEQTAGGLRISLLRMRVSDAQTATGRARVEPDGEQTETLTADRVFLAIGAESEGWLQPPAGGDGGGHAEFGDGDGRPANRSLHLSHCVLRHAEMPVIYGGDLATPVKSVTDAIASGKQAAMVLDTLFREGADAVPQRLAACRVGGGAALSMEIYLSGRRQERNPEVVPFEAINTDYFPPADRTEPAAMPPARRITGFMEAVPAMTADQARSEAARCFNCGICNDCDNCRLYCPEVAISLDSARRIDLDYCKGCGICVVECPRAAMSLTEENK